MRLVDDQHRPVDALQRHLVERRHLVGREQDVELRPEALLQLARLRVVRERALLVAEVALPVGRSGDDGRDGRYVSRTDSTMRHRLQGWQV